MKFSGKRIQGKQVFILTEKSSVAKDIAEALGGFKNCGGYFRRGNDCIAYAQGHLLELFLPEEYNPAWKTWNRESLPIIPPEMKYHPNIDGKKQLKIIKECFEKFGQDDFILATDPEREGELIGHLILEYCGFKDYNSSKRFWVAEALTPEVVKKGLKEAKPLSEYSSYKDAGLARQHADWIVGLNITRLLTVSGGGALFSFGRVQTAVLGAIYLREKSIENFKPAPYNEVEAKLENFSLFLTSSGETKFSPDSSILKLARQIFPSDTMEIVEVKKELKKENPPQLFNITGLQKYCSTHFKLSPKTTLEIAQKLYEEYKCLSYPRTPSTVLGDDNVKLFREKYELLKNNYSSFTEGCAEENISSANKRIFNSAKLQDHHALIPLNVLPESASENKRKVFEAVVKRFFETVKKEHIYNSVSVKGKCKGLEFTGKGKQVIQKGFRSAENESPPAGGLEEVPVFPEIKQGENYKVQELKILEKFTKPKPHFTESSILSLMENPKNEDGSKIHGIGTPATRADIIQKLFSHEFIEKSKQNILITKKGKWLIDTVLKNPVLRDFIGIATTTMWEQRLEENPDEFLSGIKEWTRKAVSAQGKTEVFEEEAIGMCPVCKKGKILENQKSFYCSEYKGGCKFTVWKNICGAKITVSDVRDLLSKGKTKQKKMKSQKGNDFEACVVLKNGKTEIEFSQNKLKR